MKIVSYINNYITLYKLKDLFDLSPENTLNIINIDDDK